MSTDVLIRPRNHGAFYCKECGNSFNRRAFRRFTHSAVCAVCETEQERDSAGIYVQSRSAKFINNPALVLDANWYHGTTVMDWHNAVVKADAWVHIGTEYASRHIMGSSGGDLHTVRIKPETHVSSIVLDDFATGWSYWLNNWSEVEAADEKYGIGYRIKYRGTNPFIEGANLYLNRYESPGSVSIFIPARFLEVTKTQKVS